MDYEWWVYKVKVHFKELVVGAAVASLLVFPWSTLFEPQPYKDVEIVSVMEVDDYVIVKANFHKNECTFNRLEVVGTDLGGTNVLKWEDIDPDQEDPDRSVGQQTLRIKILTDGQPYDQFEIRTRHICDDGKVVDGVFAVIKSHLHTIRGSVHDA